MADEKSRPKAGEAGAKPAGGGTSEFQTFAFEYEEDRKTLRWAVGIAVLVHVVFLFIHFPELAQQEVAAAEKKKAYVVEQVRFKPPPPQRQREIPQPRTRVVPIPDPTPDDPEPIRPPEDFRPDFDLPETDILIELPEGPPPEPEPIGPVPVGGDVRAPVRTYDPPPRYTEVARRARIEGFVIVEATIDRQGNVVDARILKGLPMGLDQEALNAIREWKFEPATLNGKPVAVFYNLTVKFTLQ